MAKASNFMPTGVNTMGMMIKCVWPLASLVSRTPSLLLRVMYHVILRNAILECVSADMTH